ncbi:TIGR03620 family F420-dependent LLM class oxidoreductase [Actinoplanes sp. NPDC049265]|uniref:TIGR03620 family F420-dependent LLM class oxidoreductase n=1 Tax=Actinoplanes sp. NPDC049265 TaxID=3363902 RepID=UPI003717AB95
MTSLRSVQPRYAVTTGDLDHLTAAQARDYVRGVERAGFGMLWLAEVLGREAFTTAQLALAATSTMMIGNGVARALEREPKNAAAAQAGLCEAYPGRYVLGLGVSGAVRDRGVGPVPFMAGYLDEIDRNLARTGHTTPAWRVLGAYSEGLTRLAARRADGLLTFLVTPEHTAWARSVLGPEPFLAVAQWVVPSTDRDEVRAVARRALRYYLGLPHQLNKLRRLGFTDDDLAPPGSDRLIDTLVASGPPDRIEAHLRQHFDAGADQVAISLLGPAPADKAASYRDLAVALGQAV